MSRPARRDSRINPAHRSQTRLTGLARFAALFISLAITLSACGASVRPAVVVWPTEGATPAPTPTSAPDHPLAWQSAELPFQPSGSREFEYDVAAAWNDPDTAYACAVPGSQSSRVLLWVTHDRGASWTAIAPPTVAAALGSCGLIVDDLQSQVLMLQLCTPSTQPRSFCATSSSFLTPDGGATWERVSGALPFFTQLATHGTATLALTQTPPQSACLDCTTALAISGDSMRSWTRIDGPIVAAGRFVTRFWVEPASGVILAETSNHYAQEDDFWLSADGGQHWRETPGDGMDGYVVQTPQPGSPWRACGYHASAGSRHPTYPSFLECTNDGGQTWSEAGGPFLGPTAGVSPIAMLADGSVLAIAPDPTARGQLEVRRLVLNATSWESLGQLPSAVAFPAIVEGSNPVTIWLLPADSSIALGSRTLYSARFP